MKAKAHEKKLFDVILVCWKKMFDCANADCVLQYAENKFFCDGLLFFFA